MDITGKKLFVKALLEEGVDTVFAYPGGTVTDLFDELYLNGKIDLVLPRHEQALVHEAEGYARETGKTGVCLVTSGPGATNTVTAIADAFYDSIPLVVFTGQVPLNLIGNDAFQEVDIVGMTRGITKYSVTVRDRKDLGRTIKMAFHIAKTGKPGPVLIDLPKDIQTATGPAEYPDHVEIRGYKINEGVHLGQLKKATKLLKVARRPLILAGGGVNIAGASELLEQVVNITHVPVVTTVMGKGAIPTDNPYYVGSSGMHGRYAANIAVSKCDVLFSIGTRFNDRITGDLNEFAPKAKIIHVDIDAAAISRNVVVDVPIVADAKVALQQMLEWVEPKDTDEWVKQIAAWDHENPLEMRRDKGMTPQMIMEGLNQVYDEVTYVTDVGQHQMWASQYLDVNKNKRMITSGGLGTMGYGLGASLGAQVGCPDKRVINIAGDGCFRMNMNELATASRYNIPIIEVIINNQVLGMVRQWQTLFYGKRYSQTVLNDKVDYIKLSEALGVKAIRVTKKEEVEGAIKEALSTKGPVVIEVVIESDDKVFPMVAPGKNLEDCFDEKDLQKQQ